MFVCYRQSGHSRLRSAVALIVPALVAALIFLPWQVYTRQHFPQEAAIESRYNYLHFFEALEGQGEPWCYFLNRMRIDYGELIYLPILAALITVVGKKGSAEWLLLVWAGIPLLVFSAAATKMPAYLFVAAPSFFLLTAVFVDRLFAGEYLQGKSVWRKLLIAVFLLIPVRYCIERGKFFRKGDRNPQWVRDIRDWAKTMPKRPAAYVLLGYKAPIEAMFYTDCIAYDYYPDPATVSTLQKRGYTIVLATANPELEHLPGVLHFPGTLPPY